MTNTYANLNNIINELQANGKTAKVTVLRSAAKRNRKSALGVKSHSSNRRRSLYMANQVTPVSNAI